MTLLTLLTFLHLLHGSLSYTLSSSTIHLVTQDDAPVLVELYYESFCPGCRAFITGGIWSAFEQLKDTGIMKVAMYPYGNAHESLNPDGSWKFECQHGGKECLGNLLEVCLMAHMNWDFNSYLPVISCMEGADNPVSAARGCVKELSNIPFRTVKACALGIEGNSLMHVMANKTETLNPPHQYVPWIVVQGKHTEDIEEQARGDLVGLVCQMYQGRKPSQCSTRLAVSNVFIQNDFVEENYKEEEVEKDVRSIETNCVMCKFIVSTLDRMVADKKNEKEIEAALEVLCSLLPSSKVNQCDNIVEAYTELIIDMLTKDISPEMLCQKLNLCPGGK